MEELEEKVANEFRNIQFSKNFTDRVESKAKELIQRSRDTREDEVQAQRNRIKALESKRNTLEDSLLDHTIDKETFKRKHNELEVQIQNLENEIATIVNQSGFDIDVISDVLSLTRNIYDTYQNANFEAKRHYLSIFFKRIEIKDKDVAKVEYTDLFNNLHEAEKVRVSTNWLQSPPNVLYKIFPPDALARVKVQLQVLQDLLKLQTNYTVVEANNGRFWKIPVPVLSK